MMQSNPIHSLFDIFNVGLVLFIFLNGVAFLMDVLYGTIRVIFSASQGLLE